MTTTASSETTTPRKPARVEFRLGTNAHACPNIITSGHAAFGYFVLCGTASARTGRPGFVTESIASGYGYTKRWKYYAKCLVEAGMWKPAKGGWEMVPVRCGRSQLFKFVYFREPIPADLRKRVMERDGHTCIRCGATRGLTLDHIRPWSLGGPDTFENLQTLCRPCNSKKGALVAPRAAQDS